LAAGKVKVPEEFTMERLLTTSSSNPTVATVAVVRAWFPERLNIAKLLFEPADDEPTV
jgi:hypothetical protein